MTISSALNWAQAKLKKSKISHAYLDAELILSFLLKKDRSFLLAHPDIKLTPIQTKKFFLMIKKRSRNYPLAYIIKQKPFYNLNLYVDERVLIPRPETETLVDLAIALIKKYNLKKIADIGTGSGAIALALKKELPYLTVYGTDISKKALEVAQKNARRLKLHINFKQGDLLKPLKGKKIDLAVANLPYLAPSYFRQGAKEIKYEPKKALLAKKQGLEYYQSVIKQINIPKQPPAFIIFELDPRNIFNFKKWLINSQNIKPGNININKDLSKKNRFLTIKLK